MARFADALAAVAARVASVLGPAGMRLVAGVNKYVANPLLRPWATRMRHLAVVEHRGRRSGRRYATPVMAFVDADSITVVLNYGTGSDWVRNVAAAGSAVVVHRDVRYVLTDPRILPIDSPELPSGARGVGDATRYALRANLSRV